MLVGTGVLQKINSFQFHFNRWLLRSCGSEFQMWGPTENRGCKSHESYCACTVRF